MPIISGSTVIRGSKGTPVAQDSNDKLITVIQGSEDIAIKQAATGELLAELLGSEGIAIKQKAVTGELIAELVGSTGNPIAQDASDKIISIMQGDNGVAISQDASNRLEAAMYGDQGVVAQDVNNKLISVIHGSQGAVIAQDAANKLIAILQGSQGAAIAQDASNKIIAVMQGSQGNNIAQDASDRLIAMLYGSQGTPVSQDANDNLIAVMKGEYLSVLQTIALDKNYAMKAVLYESEDVWGNLPGIGVGELAVREHAPPVPFDKRGNVAYWDRFESTTMKGIDSSDANSSVALSANTSYDGDFSLRLNAAAGEVAKDRYYHTELHDDKVGISFIFATADVTNTILYLWVYHRVGDGNGYVGLVKINLGTNVIYVNDGSDQNVGTLQYHGTIRNWSLVKIVVDFSSMKYHRLIISGQEIDVSAYNLVYFAAPATRRQFDIILGYENNGTGVKTAYMDNYVITDNEPV